MMILQSQNQSDILISNYSSNCISPENLQKQQSPRPSWFLVLFRISFETSSFQFLLIAFVHQQVLEKV